MPSTVQATSIETPPPGLINEEVVDHPLSPNQEQGVEAIVSPNILKKKYFLLILIFIFRAAFQFLAEL